MFNVKWEVRKKSLEKVKKTLEKIRSALENPVSRDILGEKIGGPALELMRDRIERGEDIYGKEFKPYSKAYGEWKKKKVGTDRVNMRLTGKMVESLRWKVFGNRKLVIYVKNESYDDRRITTTQLGVVHQRGLRITKRNHRGYFRMPRREWFGFTGKDYKELKRIIINVWTEYMREIGWKR